MGIIELIGLLGIIAIAISWVPQTLKVIGEKKSDIALKFILLYATGSILLLIYSILIRDWIYITLNVLTTVMAAINLSYTMK